MTQPHMPRPGKLIPYSRPSVSSNELKQIRRVLRFGWLTTGPVVDEFERAFAAKVGAKYAVAFSSGTAALVGACAAAKLEQNDRLLTSTLSFIASANCGRFFNAAVDLADVDDRTLNLTADELDKRLHKNTRIVVAVHYAGHPVDLQTIRRVCRKRNLVLIEDAAHALGATYKTSTIGDCRYSDMCAFSFHPAKLITTAEGGMVTTNTPDFHQRLLTFRNHGMTRPGRLEPWEYDCRELSFNWRLSDVHCAIGLAQLERMDHFVARRREIAAYYNERFAGCLELITPVELADCRHAYHLYVIRLREDRLKINRRGLYDRLRDVNIVPQVHYRPIHLHTYYRRLGYAPGDFPQAEAAYRCMLSLPMYPDLTNRQARFVADTLIRLIGNNRRK